MKRSEIIDESVIALQHSPVRKFYFGIEQSNCYKHANVGIFSQRCFILSLLFFTSLNS